jgi:hypothetical protein
MKWKGYRRKQLAKFYFLAWYFPGGTEENHKNLSQDSQSLGQNLNLGSTEKETEMHFQTTFSKNMR